MGSFEMTVLVSFGRGGGLVAAGRRCRPQLFGVLTGQPFDMIRGSILT
jgi:hypothetical protein